MGATVATDRRAEHGEPIPWGSRVMETLCRVGDSRSMEMLLQPKGLRCTLRAASCKTVCSSWHRPMHRIVRLSKKRFARHTYGQVAGDGIGGKQLPRAKHFSPASIHHQPTLSTCQSRISELRHGSLRAGVGPIVP